MFALLEGWVTFLLSPPPKVPLPLCVVALVGSWQLLEGWVTFLLKPPTKGFTAAVRSSAGEVLVGHEVGDPISVILQLSGSGVYLLDLRQLIIIFRFNLNQYFFVILFVTSGIFKLVI